MEKRGWMIAAGSAAAGVAAAEALRWWRQQDIKGHVVLITGGSRGLGLALARRFAELECRVAICGRDEGSLRRAAADLESRGASVLAVPCDVTDRAQVDRMVAGVLSHYGTVDILVNNAGSMAVAPVGALTVEDFQREMDVMFWGTVHPTMALLPHFTSRGSGRVVNIASIGGKVSVPHLLPYNCAKFAAVGFSEGLHAELAGSGIKVVTIAPGLMRTGSYLNAWFAGDSEREAAWFSAGASMPFVSMSARRAARQIVASARRGETERILSTPASLLARFHGLFPGATAGILGLLNRLLPQGTGRVRRQGHETAMGSGRGAAAALTYMGRRAAGRYHETPETEAGRPARRADVPVGGRHS